MTAKPNATRIIIVAIALIALSTVIWRISDVVIVMFGGVVGAATLRALALPLIRSTSLGENWSISTVLVALLVLLGLAIWLFGNQISEQAGELQKSMPLAWHSLLGVLDKNPAGKALVTAIKSSAHGDQTLTGVGFATGALLTAATDLLLLIFLAVYLAYEPEQYLDGALRLVPPGRRVQVRAAFVDAGLALRSWVLAQLIAMAIIGIMVGIGMAVLGVPFSLLLGCVAGMLEFIPVAGAIAFTLPGVLLAFAKGPMLAFYALLVYVAVQQLESNLIIPLLQRWAVRIPPAVTLVSVVVGGVLFGAVGVIFATPLAVVVMALIRHLYVEDTLEKQITSEPVAVPAAEI